MLAFKSVLVTVKNTADPVNYICLPLPISIIKNFFPKGEKDMKSKGRETKSFLFVEGRRYFLSNL